MKGAAVMHYAPETETRGEKVIRFAEKYLRVPEGELIGTPLLLQPFQKKFITDVYDNPAGTRRAILSTGRKNGKTALIAVLLLSHIAGSEAIPNSQIVSGAMSREQASLVFDLACKMIRMSPELSRAIRILPSQKKLVGLNRNVEYKALSAEGKTAHGLSPVMAILDEVGQVSGSSSPFIDAIVTSQGAHKNPLLIVISTQAATDNDLLSIWIDDAKSSADPRIVCHVYETPMALNILDESGWRMSNPALGVFRSFDDMREQMTQAARMPSSESTARNLLLNQRIAVNNPFISRNAWLAILEKDIPPVQACTEVYGGLDLSARHDLTAMVLVGRLENKRYIYPYFWMPSENLVDKAKRDRAPYDTWVAHGLIKTTPSASIEYDWLAHDIQSIIGDIELRGIAYDRWRMDILKKEFDNIGISIPLYPWGQGFKDMSPALDALEGRILNKTIHHNGHAVLTMCAHNAVLVKNPAGDRKLEKVKTSGRIDGMVALCMAAGLAERAHVLEGSLDDFLANPIII